MILYHFPMSPFARRVRVAMSLKGLTAELRDARSNPTHKEEMLQLNPMHTVPVLVDGDRVITQSAAILHYLDEKQPAPALWPTGAARAHTAETIAKVDDIITVFVELGLRYAALHNAPEFAAVRDVMRDRAQRTYESLGSVASSKDWHVGEQALYLLVTWLEGLPARAAAFPLAQRMLDLGMKTPPELTQWADQHRQRPEVLALG
jgi:glutathione S-transferase